ncbi:MAG TPA: L-histidine N(alpha)-methyltransferase [Terriglobales bacterium]|nr:L-histidine N(alpha)-methyltransferase [Terriglobales bacterium]
MSAYERAERAVSPIAEVVLAGLMQRRKSLPPKLFYDAEGSQLFERITELPEYYLTRTEARILERYAGQMVEAAGDGLTLVELGAGTATKTRIVIRELLSRQSRVTFYPIDVSHTALEDAVRNLNGDYAGLEVRPVVADYCEGLDGIANTSGEKLVLYLGSSIGNFEPMRAGAVLHSVRGSLRKGEALLLGTDLVKSERVLVPAYDDAQGVTERFNKNVLARINRELGGHFDLKQFKHVAEWNPKCSRMEIYLESLREQTVSVDSLAMRVHFEQGERIHTENSYKFNEHMVRSILSMGGFELERTWTDRRNWFAVHLARVK